MKKYMVGILCILASVAVSHRAIASMDMVHPGILETKAQFRFVKNNLNSEPWKSAYEKILKDPRAKLDYKPTPWKTVECGSYSNPNFGCTDETRDASAAYTQVILWQLTGNTQYAENTRKILNAWAETLEGGHTNSNGPLQAAWSAETFTRATEILEYTYAGWTKEEKAKVKKMFSEQYLPDIKRMFSGAYGCYNNNWQASGIEGMLNIGIFTRNEALFNEAIDKWKSLLPAYIYLKSDGPIPANTSWCSRPTSQIVGTWNNPTELTDGLSKESCRDFEHTAYGIAALINVAETAYIQGIDLYNDKETKAAERLQKTMELHAKYQNNDSGLPQLCKDYEGIKLNTVGTFEIGYNEYVVRKGNTLTETEVFLQRTRPTTGRFHYLWETMTHGLIGYAE